MKKLLIFSAIIFALYFLYRMPATQSSEPQKTHTLTGTAPKVQTVELNRGLAIFTLAFYGDKNQHIAVKVIDPGRSTGYTIINETGSSYNGSTTYSVKNSGTHTIEVKLQGNWKLDIK